jgi:hypothetical protein
MSGALKIVASEDLGGLGLNESAAVSCPMSWSLPIREALPWLLLGGVLLMERRSQRHNRWLIMALAVGYSMIWGLSKTLYFVPPEVVEALSPVFQAWLYGFAMVLLLSARLTSPKRGTTVLKMLLVVGVSSSLMLYGLIDIDSEPGFIGSFIGLLVLWAGTLVSLEASSRICRRRFNLVAFVVTQGLICFGALLGVLFLLMWLSNSNLGWELILTIAGVAVAVGALILTPIYLVLFLHPDQRLRLNELFH